MNTIGNKIARLQNPILSHVKLGNPLILNVIKANQSYYSLLAKHIAAVALFQSMSAYRKIKKISKGETKPVVKKEYPSDTVILYHFPRGINTPSLSPFALKLETWLRAADIKYQNELGFKTSNQGLIPFIQLNGFTVNDSQNCINYLTKVSQINLNKDLTEEQKAIGRSVLKLCEDSLRWSALLHRFYLSKQVRKETGLPLLRLWYISYNIYRDAYYAGYGRFSKEEIYENGKRDLTTLNTLIGKKKYLFSDTKPCDTDFAIFGVCAQIKYNDLGPLNIHLNTECHNVVRHIENMKQTYWPDWNQNLLPVKPKKSLLSRLIKRK